MELMETLLKDIRYGLRGLWKRPAFTIVALVILALGIGANTAIFTLIDAVLLKPCRLIDPSNWCCSTTRPERAPAHRMAIRHLASCIAFHMRLTVISASTIPRFRS